MSLTPPLLFKRAPQGLLFADEPQYHRQHEHHYHHHQQQQQQQQQVVQSRKGSAAPSARNAVAANECEPSAALQPVDVNELPAASLMAGAKPPRNGAATNMGSVCGLSRNHHHALRPGGDAGIGQQQQQQQQQQHCGAGSSGNGHQQQNFSRGQSISALISNSVQLHNQLHSQQEAQLQHVQQYVHQQAQSTLGLQHHHHHHHEPPPPPHQQQQQQYHHHHNQRAAHGSSIASNLQSWHQRMQEEQEALRQLDAEDRQIAVEEQQIKSQLLEHMLQQREVDTQMLEVQRGWAKLYDDQLALQAAPTIDLTADIDTLAARVAVVRQQEAGVRTRLDAALAHSRSFDHLESSQKLLLDEIGRLELALQELHARHSRAQRTMRRLVESEAARGTAALRLQRSLEQDAAALEREIERLDGADAVRGGGDAAAPPPFPASAKSILKKGVVFADSSVDQRQPRDVVVGEAEACGSFVLDAADSFVLGGTGEQAARESSSGRVAGSSSIIIGDDGACVDVAAARPTASDEVVNSIDESMVLLDVDAKNYGVMGDGGDSSIIVSVVTDTKRKRLEAFSS